MLEYNYVKFDHIYAHGKQAPIRNSQLFLVLDMLTAWYKSWQTNKGYNGIKSVHIVRKNLVAMVKHSKRKIHCMYDLIRYLHLQCEWYFGVATIGTWLFEDSFKPTEAPLDDTQTYEALLLVYQRYQHNYSPSMIYSEQEIINALDKYGQRIGIDRHSQMKYHITDEPLHNDTQLPQIPNNVINSTIPQISREINENKGAELSEPQLPTTDINDNKDVALSALGPPILPPHMINVISPPTQPVNENVRNKSQPLDQIPIDNDDADAALQRAQRQLNVRNYNAGL
eukprot:251458_1